MVLVDANVLLDILTQDVSWFAWSEKAMRGCVAEGLAINAIIYAELSAGFDSPQALDEALDFSDLKKLPLPYEAGFLAGKAFVKYRRGGGGRRSPLPDFYIGAHAQTADLRLLTRDPLRFRKYFPSVELIAPRTL
jgi:predicted nucleic acid-binding protein